MACGVHSNVGGGFEDKGLSSITVRLMIDRAKECDLTFDESYLEGVIKPGRDGRLYDSRQRRSHRDRAPVGSPGALWRYVGLGSCGDRRIRNGPRARAS